MRQEEIKKILNVVCDGYVDSIMTAIEEDDIKDLSITIACANFLAELKEKNIIFEFVGTFEDTIIDRVIREITNYLAR